MAFDFDAAVCAPFRMQPGLRRVAPGQPSLTPAQPGSRHQREKLAVLGAFAGLALGRAEGFDETPALHALARLAAAEQPAAWAWDGTRAEARHLGAAVVCAHGGHGARVERTREGTFGLGDEITRCLEGLPPAWRLAGLLALAFEEDLALIDRGGHVPWLAVCLPSHWAPQEKCGRHFAQIHAPVADNTRLIQAAEGLVGLVTGGGRWERFVWNVTDQPRLHAHPEHAAPRDWLNTRPEAAWFRSERQTFVPLPGLGLAAFTIQVEVMPLARVIDSAARARALHDAVASMSPAVLDYRGLGAAREPLLAWLASREALLSAAPATAAAAASAHAAPAA
jgi:hypothetical protein